MISTAVANRSAACRWRSRRSVKRRSWSLCGIPHNGHYVERAIIPRRQRAGSVTLRLPRSDGHLP